MITLNNEEYLIFFFSEDESPEGGGPNPEQKGGLWFSLSHTWDLGAICRKSLYNSRTESI